jgi:hypothetical protein
MMEKKKKKKEKKKNRTRDTRLEEEEMDWEENLVGVDKLLYPDLEEGDSNLEDSESLLDESMEDEGVNIEEEARMRREEEEELAKRMRAQARAEEYIERKKREAESRFKRFMESLSMNQLEYEAVRRANSEQLKVVRADGNVAVQRGTGSLVNSMDGRLRYTNMSTSLNEKKI